MLYAGPASAGWEGLKMPGSVLRPEETASFTMELPGFVYKCSRDVEEVVRKLLPQGLQSGRDRDTEVTRRPAGPPAELSVTSVPND